jgi:hypothetical protein
MKHLRETFTDQEFQELLKAKHEYPLPINWHDFILLLSKEEVKECLKLK